MAHSLDAAADVPLLRVRLDPPMPCGNSDCDQRSHSALFEPDPDHPGLWLAFPLCERCLHRMDHEIAQVPARMPARDRPHSEQT